MQGGRGGREDKETRGERERRAEGSAGSKEEEEREEGGKGRGVGGVDGSSPSDRPSEETGVITFLSQGQWTAELPAAANREKQGRKERKICRKCCEEKE